MKEGKPLAKDLCFVVSLDPQSLSCVERSETFLQFAQDILVHGITSSEIGSTFHGSARPCQTLRSIPFGRPPGSTKSWKIFRPLPRCLLGWQRFLLAGPWRRARLASI